MANVRTFTLAQMEDFLREEGYTKEPELWRIKTRLVNTDGYFFSKFVPHEDHEINVGVVLSEEFGSMEVLMCPCTVGCCGHSQNIHPFSIETINKLLEAYKSELT